MNPFDVFGLHSIARLSDAETRSISAENPDGSRGGGAKASPDLSRDFCPSSELGQGWKCRPCIPIKSGETITIADIEGPGVVQHIWFTIPADRVRLITLRVYYDDQDHPSIVSPVGDFFANGLDGCAIIGSIPIAVNPRGGMNAYWPMPFRARLRIEISNDGWEDLPEFFYQVTYALTDVPDDAAYLHAHWRRSMTTREHPEHTILDGVEGRGHYVGTYLAWNQFSNDWWGEGEVKFYLDGDREHPTICGTGTEDYFGGAWGFRAADNPDTSGPVTYSTPYLGYPQALIGGERVPAHGLYRWHIPDPIRFKRDCRVTVQALGWYPSRKFQPLTDDIASVAYWYQTLPSRALPDLPSVNDRLPR